MAIDSTFSSIPPGRVRRIRFALFIKILFRVLEEKDRLVSGEAKYIVTACIRQHLQGKTLKYDSMMDAIELNLRGLVQKDTWRNACHYAKVYFFKHQKEILRAMKEDNEVDEANDQDQIEIEMLRPYEKGGIVFEDDSSSSSDDSQCMWPREQHQRVNSPTSEQEEVQPQEISSSLLLPTSEIIDSTGEYADLVVSS